MATIEAGYSAEGVHGPVLHGEQLWERKPRFFRTWERRRPVLVSELLAEAFGVWMFCFGGFGATAAFIITTIAEIPGQGSLLNIAFAYALCIVFAVVVGAMSSGGHFHPGLTIAHVLFNGFPLWKAPLYIFFQILGGVIGGLTVHAMYYQELHQVEAALTAAGHGAAIFTNQGTAGIFALYATTGRDLGRVFLNEFFVCLFLGIILWAILDPTNFFVVPHVVPAIAGMAYFTIIIGFAPANVSANAARDLGGRIAACIIYGSKAWGNKSYSAIAALTNIPATIIAAAIYELLFADSARVVPTAIREVLGNQRHELARKETRKRSGTNATDVNGSLETGNEKGLARHVDNV